MGDVTAAPEGNNSGSKVAYDAWVNLSTVLTKRDADGNVVDTRVERLNTRFPIGLVATQNAQNVRLIEAAKAAKADGKEFATVTFTAEIRLNEKDLTVVDDGFSL